MAVKVGGEEAELKKAQEGADEAGNDLPLYNPGIRELAVVVGVVGVYCEHYEYRRRWTSYVTCLRGRWTRKLFSRRGLA